MTLVLIVSALITMLHVQEQAVIGFQKLGEPGVIIQDLSASSRMAIRRHALSLVIIVNGTRE